VQRNLSVAVAFDGEPADATSAIRTALHAAGACIVSAEQFGNQGLVFGFELAADQLPALWEQLRQCTRLLGDSDHHPDVGHELEVHGMLHVSLVHHAPDQRVPRPRVPG
jgi:hypothetical protein